MQIPVKILVLPLLSLLIYNYDAQTTYTHGNLLFSSVQSMALRAAFSRGSPTMSPSRMASDWHEASTHCVSKEESFASVMDLDFEEGVELGAEFLSLGLHVVGS